MRLGKLKMSSQEKENLFSPPFYTKITLRQAGKNSKENSWHRYIGKSKEASPARREAEIKDAALSFSGQAGQEAESEQHHGKSGLVGASKCRMHKLLFPGPNAGPTADQSLPPGYWGGSRVWSREEMIPGKQAAYTWILILPLSSSITLSQRLSPSAHVSTYKWRRWNHLEGLLWWLNTLIPKKYLAQSLGMVSTHLVLVIITIVFIIAVTLTIKKNIGT